MRAKFAEQWWIQAFGQFAAHRRVNGNGNRRERPPLFGHDFFWNLREQNGLLIKNHAQNRAQEESKEQKNVRISVSDRHPVFLDFFRMQYSGRPRKLQIQASGASRRRKDLPPNPKPKTASRKKIPIPVWVAERFPPSPIMVPVRTNPEKEQYHEENPRQQPFKNSAPANWIPLPLLVLVSAAKIL